MHAATHAATHAQASLMAARMLEDGAERYTLSDVAYRPGCPVDVIEESQPLEASIV